MKATAWIYMPFFDCIGNLIQTYEEEQKMEFVPTRKTEVKKGKKWEASTSDPMTGAEVYRALAEDMVYKYIHKASFIKSIKRKTNYDGTQTIIVTYDHNGIATDDVRAIYHIKNC